MTENAKMVGYCGYKCHLCAARSEDPAIRQKMVYGWRKLFGHENYTAENVQCVGCLNEGKHADKQCRARPCAIEKGVKNCAYCDRFPCDRLRPLIPRIFFATEEEYNLCMKQFDCRTNLTEILAETGKPPFWVKRQSNASKRRTGIPGAREQPTRR
jgi:hypothetical protein